MATNYSIETVNKLKQLFQRLNILRPHRTRRYDAGDEMTYDITGVFPAHEGRITVKIEDYIGGGYAGQVYRISILNVETAYSGAKSHPNPVESTHRFRLKVPPDSV